MIDVIDSLKKLLAFVNPGKFGQMVLNFMIFESKAQQRETVKLDLDGYALFVYKNVFKQPFPKFPTPEQKQRMNAIWDALGHPEKKLP